MSNVHKYSPPQDYENLVLAWIGRSRESQMSHYEMADLLDKKGKWLGVPVIILTTLVSASAFASVIEEVVPMWAKLVVGLVSIAAAVLSSLQTFFNYSGISEKHRAAAAHFGAVRRKLESIYAGRASGIDQKQVDVLREELDTLAQESLNVPVNVFKRVQNTTLYKTRRRF